MALTTRSVFIPCILALLCLSHAAYSAMPDESALDVRINVELRDASMHAAAAMVANAAGIPVIASGETAKGIVMTMNSQTVRQVLDALAKSTGIPWSWQDGIIIFAKPPEAAAPARVASAEVIEPMEPKVGMSQIMESLSNRQFYALSSGRPIGYLDMSEYQQTVLAGILSAPNTGLTDTGETITQLPSPKQATVWFATLPYLSVPDPAGQGPALIRLDSTRFILLQGGKK